MNEQQMKDRTKAFGLRIIRLSTVLPRTPAGDVIVRQLLRSATSVGANYRASRRAKSTADFINKLGTVEEEADESAYWLEVLAESGLVKPERLRDLLKESDELVAMVVATIRKAKQRRQQSG